jgi:hypothetical protein
MRKSSTLSPRVGAAEAIEVKQFQASAALRRHESRLPALSPLPSDISGDPKSPQTEKSQQTSDDDNLLARSLGCIRPNE